MDVTQIYNLVNTSISETLGEEAVVNEDLSNLVDVGEAVFNANAVDRYVKSLVNHIGKVVFVNRPYNGSAPSVLMDDWEFGSVMEKIHSDMPEATINETWELEDGTSYDPFVFYKPNARAKFYNKAVTFEIDRSVTKEQVKQSFSSATQLNAFSSMLFNETEKSLTVATDNLIMRTINSMIADTVFNAYSGGAITTAGNTRAVNLLALYNTAYTKTLTAAQAAVDPDFIRYASFIIKKYSKHMTRMSTLFNQGGKARFTPSNLQHIVMLDEFYAAAETYLYSDTYHEGYVKLSQAETVPFWQGSGSDFAFESNSKIDVKTGSGNTQSVTGVLGVIFDRDALGVCCQRQEVETQYNPKGGFTNYFYKRFARYFNDSDENFVVFFAA